MAHLFVLTVALGIALTAASTPASLSARASEAKNTPDASSLGASRPSEDPPPPTVKQARRWGARKFGGKLNLEPLPIVVHGKTYVLLVAWKPLPDWNVDTVVPEDVRGGARLFFFLSAKPTEIGNPGFCTPDDPKDERERPYLNCDPANVYYLAKNREPAIVAQTCSEENEYVTRYLVFGGTNLENPVNGTARSAPGFDTTSPCERFVPADEPWLGNPSRFRGDGRTIIDGQEIDRAGQSPRTRNYRIEWDGQGLRKVTEPWRSVGRPTRSGPR
jgi:hypothetical protein